MLYNEIKNEEGVNAMTNENYISYLVGTANGYPSKTQRYLKMLFSTAGIAVPDDQIHGANFLQIIDDKISSLKFDTDYSSELSRHPAESNL